jgi:hypothetical protein
MQRSIAAGEKTGRSIEYRLMVPSPNQNNRNLEFVIKEYSLATRKHGADRGQKIVYQICGVHILIAVEEWTQNGP